MSVAQQGMGEGGPPGEGVLLAGGGQNGGGLARADGIGDKCVHCILTLLLGLGALHGLLRFASVKYLMQI